jgi:hypothetical protein
MARHRFAVLVPIRPKPIRPATFRDEARKLRPLSSQCQHEGHRLLGDRRRVSRARDHDGDFVPRHGWDIDGIVTNARPRDDFDPARRCVIRLPERRRTEDDAMDRCLRFQKCLILRALHEIVEGDGFDVTPRFQDLDPITAHGIREEYLFLVGRHRLIPI